MFNIGDREKPVIGYEALAERMRGAMKGRLPELFGIELVSVKPGAVDARLTLKPKHLAPNDFVHAGTVIALADSAAGMGCLASLPEGVGGFTTVELKANFLRTVKDGELVCHARMQHGGGRTQVWDAEVMREPDGKSIALFRCTQMLLKEQDPRTSRQREQRKAAGSR